MKKTLTLLLVCSLLAGLAVPVAAESITHGTSNQWVQDNMLRNDPPEDYRINQATQASATKGLYNAYFLESELQEVHIEIEQNNLNWLLQNATAEKYVMTTSVTIGDTTIGYCGLRTKGNYTLSHAYTDNPGSDRFSFTVNFGEYINAENYGEKQTFYGCERISFNNFFFDKSMMKEYCAFKLMDEMGLPTPQYCLAKLYINDAYYGVYFMVEAMDETILQQHWGVKGSELSDYLCKPTGTKLDYGSLSMDSDPLWEWNDDTYTKVESMLPTVLTWVQKLNQLSVGLDFSGNTIDVNSDEYITLLKSILDLDEVVKYFAVSSWLCQTDNMFVNLQNYALYVSQDGVATLLPWDYDLAFGCYYPSTAQLTANYPVDVMYRLDRAMYSQEADMSALTYEKYPLFNVIYQNDTLMEQYHQYMLECSKVAALGGSVASTGKTYDPGYLNSCIEALQTDLIDAATEEVASNVYYMNHITQPDDVKEALPNLSKIIAMRAVGVYAQVTGLDSTVCGSGCDLATLGNGSTGEASNSGTLTIVDSATGIFATAEYSGSGRSFAPALNISTLTEEDEVYQQVQALVELDKNDALLVYSANVIGKATSNFTLTVPLAQQYLQEEAVYQFYTYKNGQLTPLEMTQTDNLFTGETGDLSCIVVHAQLPVDRTMMYTLIALGAVAVFTAAIMIPVAIIKRKGK